MLPQESFSYKSLAMLNTAVKIIKYVHTVCVANLKKLIFGVFHQDGSQTCRGGLPTLHVFLCLPNQTHLI